MQIIISCKVYEARKILITVIALKNVIAKIQLF